MGPNNENLYIVSYDSDLDKSVPELVTEYELLSQGTKACLKASKNTLSIGKDMQSTITRQITNTFECKSCKENITSSDAFNDISNNNHYLIKEEVDSNISSLLQRQNTYTLQKSSGKELCSCFSGHELNSSIHIRNSLQIFKEVETKRTDLIDVEPFYEETENALHPQRTQFSYITNENEEAEEKIEDQFVIVDKVRTQKNKVMIRDGLFAEPTTVAKNVKRTTIPSMDVGIQDLTKEASLSEETSQPRSHRQLLIPVYSDITEDEDIDHDKNVEDIHTSKDVEQLVRDILDPNLDCSLEDIKAMIESNELFPQDEELRRVSPEFATAVTLIDQVDTCI